MVFCFSADKHIQSLILCIWNTIAATERAVVVISLWMYLQVNWGPFKALDYYSFSLFLFSLVSMLSTILFSILSYRLFRVDRLFLFAISCQIIASILYAGATAPWFVMVSRILSGLGYGCSTILYGDLTKLTEKRERLSYFVRVDACNYIGILLAPVIGLIMVRSNLDFMQIPYHNLGTVMTILYLLCFCLVLFLYPPTTRSHSESILLTNSKRSGDFLSQFKVYGKISVVTLLICAFGSCFNTLAAETSFTPYMSTHVKLSILNITVIFLSFAVTSLITLIVMNFALKSVKDVTILTVGSAIITSAYVWLLALVMLTEYFSETAFMYCTLLGILLHAIATPLIVNSSLSLYTKLLGFETPSAAQTRYTDETQKAMGIYRLFVSLGFMFGPLIGTMMWNKPEVIFGVMLLFSTPVLFSVCIWKKSFEPKMMAEEFKNTS